MTRPAESVHYYARDGSPAYTVIGKNGKERNTTLRDARLLDLVPSVTTIIKECNKEGLNHWLQEQVLLAALTLPRDPNETEKFWIERVWADSREQARKAAERGTAIHAAIQTFYEGKGSPTDYWEHVKGASKAIAERFPGYRWTAEKSFCHELSFGGKIDLHDPREQVVLDIKTKEFSDPAKLDLYPEHLMQLSAYGRGLAFDKPRAGIVFVSASVPGLAHIVMADDEDIERGWIMFVNLLYYWKARNRFGK